MYGSKSPTTQQFKILGHVAIRSLITENAEHNTFIIYGGQKAITVSAGTTSEKTLWLAELSKASTEIKSKPHVQLNLGTLKNCSKYFEIIKHLIQSGKVVKCQKNEFHQMVLFLHQQVHLKKDWNHVAHNHRTNRQRERQTQRQLYAVIMQFMCVGIAEQQLD